MELHKQNVEHVLEKDEVGHTDDMMAQLMNVANAVVMEEDLVRHVHHSTKVAKNVPIAVEQAKDDDSVISKLFSLFQKQQSYYIPESYRFPDRYEFLYQDIQ